MEKYSQYRDKGSGIAPFFPVPTPSSGISLPFHLFLFLVRLPLLVTVVSSYLLVLQWLPIGSLGRKAMLWLILAIPGIWWIDLQIDGVRRGSVARFYKTRLPQPGSIIACSCTSPIDSVYLSAIFDPIFVASYPGTAQVRRISLWQSVKRALAYPELEPEPDEEASLTDLASLVRENPTRVIAVFPECTTTNGRGILRLSPSLLGAPARAKVFPISLRYTSPDVTSPVPAIWLVFLWNLLSKPTHCIRVRIAECVYITSATTATKRSAEDVSEKEQRQLDQVAEALARLGRVKRVGLGVEEKLGFVAKWTRSRR